MAALPRILIIQSEGCGHAELPAPAAGLRTLLDAHPAQYDCHFAPLAEAHKLLTTPVSNHGPRDFAAALVLGGPGQSQTPELFRVLDDLFARHIATIWLAANGADLARGTRLAQGEGLLALPLACPAQELAARLEGLLAARPIIVQLQRENALLNRFQSGLHNQMALLDEEMRLAARIQADFLPRPLPQSLGCRFDVLFRPASYVSGDIYDAIRLDETHVGFYVADAVGHGMPAALLTIFIKQTLHTKVITERSYRIVPPHEALAHLNQEMIAQRLSQSQFATMVYGVLNTHTLELQYARAGHPLPLWYTPNGSCRELDAAGALLGAFPDESYALEKVQLSPGDSILFYSDGFESAFADADGQGIVNERYRQEFAKLRHAAPHACFAALQQELDQQAGSLHPRDDLTALCLTVGPH